MSFGRRLFLLTVGLGFVCTGLQAAPPVTAPPITAPPITATAVSPDGRHLLSASQAGIEVRRWSDLEPIGTLTTSLRQVHALRFDPAGKRLAVAGGAPGVSGEVEIFSWPEKKRLSHRRLHDDIVYDLCWQDRLIATAGHDRRCRVLAGALDKKPQTLQGHSRGLSAVVGLTDHLILTAGLDQSIRVWQSAPGAEWRLVRTLDNHTKPVHAMAVSPKRDGLPLVVSVGQDRTIRFWQPTIGRMVRFCRLPRAVPLAVLWLDEQLVAISCSDGHVRVIDSETADVVQDQSAIDGWAYCLAAHPTERKVVVGGHDGQIRKISVPGIQNR